MPRTTETPIQVTIGQVLAGVLLLLGGFLGVAYWQADQVTDDIADLRANGSEMRQEDRDIAKAREDGDAQLRQNIVDLTAQVAGLTAQLSTTNANLVAVANSSASLADSIRGMDAKLTTSIDRQKAFETYIVARLGSTSFMSPEFPTSWDKSTVDVLSQIKTGDNPLIKWIGKDLPQQ